MNLAGSFFDDALRAAVRKQAVAVIPDSHVDEVVDLACNSAEQALQTISRLTMDLAPGPVGISALGISLSLLRHRVTELEAVMRDASNAIGMPHHTAVVTVQR